MPSKGRPKPVAHFIFIEVAIHSRRSREAFGLLEEESPVKKLRLSDEQKGQDQLVFMWMKNYLQLQKLMKRTGQKKEM